MPDSRIDFGEVHLAFSNGLVDQQRAEHISQLTFEYFYELMARDLQLGTEVNITQLEVPPISVAFDGMDDERIGRLTAAAIYRALLPAL